MLDFVPFAGARREMADSDRQAALIGPTLQFPFPQVVTRAVAPPTVGGDQQPGGLRVGGPSQRRPPLADTGHGKDRRVVIGAHRYAPGIPAQIVHPVGNGFAPTQVRKIVDVDGRRLAQRVPFSPGILEVSDQLPFLGVHRNHRLALGLVADDLRIEVRKLGIPIGLGATFPDLPIPLQAYSPAHGAVPPPPCG